MSLIKEILANLGKQTTVHFEGKEKRVAFDESYEKAKMDIVAKFIGDEENSRALAAKLTRE